MKTGLKDIKKRVLKIGDIIAMCPWNYSLFGWGKTGNEYWFSTGKVFFRKGRVQWTGVMEFDDKLYDELFLIIKRGKKFMSPVNKDWNWKGFHLK